MKPSLHLEHSQFGIEIARPDNAPMIAEEHETIDDNVHPVATRTVPQLEAEARLATGKIQS
jgi:hypothetical protein